jgi:protein-tyrosine kinase
MASPKSLHLIERAAERLRQDGVLDVSAAQLLESEKPARRPDGNVPPSAASDAGDVVRVARPRLEAAVLERAGMIDWGKVRSRVAEEFRIVQGQILRTAFASDTGGAHAANLVMVTSARPGEGKSFTALNLATSIARRRDHDVLLVDVDSKPASVGQMLGFSGQKGLLDLAADPGLNPDQVIVGTEFDKLSVLPLGRETEHGADLFSTRQMARLIRDLGRRYADRLVILDAPPCLASSDASTLAPVVGQIVLVVEAERTRREEVEGAIDLIQACPTIMLLLNKVQRTTRNTFGSYGSSDPS